MHTLLCSGLKYVIASKITKVKKLHILSRRSQYGSVDMILTDDTQLKILHSAKCPNPKCDNPVIIPWKENCELVRKPFSKAENQETKQNGCIANGHGVDENLDDKLLEKNEECSACGARCTEEDVETFRKTMEFTEMHLQKMKGSSIAYVDVCKFCLEKQDGVLHPLNVMHAQTLDHAFDALIQVQLWETACVYAEKLIPCFRFYYGEKHPLLGLLHLKYGKILLYKMDLHKALEQLKLSEKILKITHGDRHPLYREQLLPLLSQAMLES